MKKAIALLISGIFVFQFCASADEIFIEEMSSEKSDNYQDVFDGINIETELISDSGLEDSFFVVEDSDYDDTIVDGVGDNENYGFVDDYFGGNYETECLEEVIDDKADEDISIDAIPQKEAISRNVRWIWSEDETTETEATIDELESELSDSDTDTELNAEDETEDDHIENELDYSAIIAGKHIHVYYEKDNDLWVLPLSLESQGIDFDTVISYLPDGVIFLEEALMPNEDSISSKESNSEVHFISTWYCEEYIKGSNDEWPENGNYLFKANINSETDEDDLYDLSIEVRFEQTEYISEDNELFAASESGECGDQLTWHIEGEILYVDGTGDMYDYEIGQTPWYDQKGVIKEVILGDGVTGIGNAAFYAFELLRDVSIPKNVTRIGENAFAECSSLEQIVLPDGLSVIEYRTFYNCKSLSCIKTISAEDQPHIHTVQVIPGKDATCTENGITEGQICSECEMVLVEQKVIPAKGHNWDGGKVIRNATYQADGIRTYRCIKCGITKTEPIPKLKKPENDGEDAIEGALSNPVSVAATDKVITTMADTDEVTGSSFARIQVQTTKQTKTSISLKWNKIKGAAGYIIYGNRCGKAYSYERLSKQTGNSIKVKKLADGTKLKPGTYHKFVVVAYKRVKNKDQIVAKSKSVHVTTKGGKGTNVSKIIIKKGSKKVKTLKLKVNKSTTLKVSKSLQNKKLKLKNHRKIMFESSNEAIATVNSKGKITAKKKGTCYIYVYSQSGVYARVKVKVS